MPQSGQKTAWPRPKGFYGAQIVTGSPKVSMSLRLSVCLGRFIGVCLKLDEARAYERIIPFLLKQAPPGSWKILKLKLHGFAVDSLTIRVIWAPIGPFDLRKVTHDLIFVPPYGFFHGCRHCFMSCDTLVHFARAPRSSTGERSKESSLAKIRHGFDRFDSLLQFRHAAKLRKYPY